ncbi:MAG: hypothetical protein HYY76_15935 [Acidobacteria bacterium]|nr:hypothetical protein [Acidobacteriota bacterium]
MRMQLNGSMIVVAVAAAVVGAAISRSLAQDAAQTSRPNARPERIGARPNFSGIWQANNEAHWDLQAHAARPGAVTQPGVYPFEYARVAAAPVVALGAAAGVPASLGVVQGDGDIPYTPEALAIRKANAENWIDRDPELKCYLPGIPRAMYMPYPFEITQSTNEIHVAYAFANTARTIHLDEVDPPPAETWMGHSVGRWDGDTLVIDVSHFNDKTWFDRAGNFHSDALHLTERFMLLTPDVIQYEVTIEDPKVFARPWRIAMPIYRRMEPNMQLLEYRCTEFAEEFLYGHVRKEPLVTRWEGETMVVEITRKVPPGDRFYEWLRK